MLQNEGMHEVMRSDTTLPLIPPPHHPSGTPGRSFLTFFCDFRPLSNVSHG